MAEKAGLDREGSMKSHSLDPNGSRRDTVCYAILRDEWHQRTLLKESEHPVTAHVERGMRDFASLCEGVYNSPLAGDNVRLRERRR